MYKKDLHKSSSNWKTANKHICCKRIMQKAQAKQKIEVFHFINPLCPECWGIEPHIKKLQIEYGHVLKFRSFLTGSLVELNAFSEQKKRKLASRCEKISSQTGMVCTGTLWLEDPIERPFILSLSIKAAEQQGLRLGNRFGRILREKMFFETKNVGRIDSLLECAKEAGLDIEEFVLDIHSAATARALQCDFKIARDYNVQVSPTLIFFHNFVEEPAVKVSGLQDFQVYEKVIHDLLGDSVEKIPLPPICFFAKKFKLFALQEVSVVYNLTPEAAREQLLPMIIRGIIKEHQTPLGYYYKYVQN